MSVVEIILKSGNKSRYEFRTDKHDYFEKNKFVYGKDIYSGNVVCIKTSEIAKYEIIRKRR